MYYIKKQVHDFSKNTSTVETGMISAIIPVYSAKLSTLPKALLSVDNQSYEKLQIIIVSDNAKGIDAIVQTVSLKHNFKIVYLSRNIGAAFARNEGACVANGEFLWFIDSDIVEIDSECALYAMRKLKNNLDIGCIGGVLYSKNSYSSFVIGRISYTDHRYNLHQYRAIDDDYVNTACIFIPRNIFFLINGFTDYIEYLHDDNDLGFKIRAAGYRCIGSYQCAGIHPAPPCLPSIFHEFMSIKNTLLYLFINYNISSFFELLHKRKTYSCDEPLQKLTKSQKIIDFSRKLCGKIMAVYFLLYHLSAIIQCRHERQSFLLNLPGVCKDSEKN
ncbi:MAG: glycosyltransferase [bacterium]